MITSKILSVVNLSCFRDLIYIIRQRNLDIQARKTFVDLMNQKSKSLGMNNTHWINPSGLGENGVYSMSTARDLALMGVHAYQNEFLRQIWSTREYDVNILRPYLPFVYKSRKLHIVTTVQSHELETHYPILGGKTGAGDGFNNLVLITKMPKHFPNSLLSVSIMGAESESERFIAIKEVLDFLSSSSETNLGLDLNFKHCKSACVFSFSTTDCSPKCLLEYNADNKAPTMSLAKLMSMMVYLDYKLNIDDNITIHPYDIENTILCSGPYFCSWQKVKLVDIIYAVLLPSSCQAANVIARLIGELNYKK